MTDEPEAPRVASAFALALLVGVFAVLLRPESAEEPNAPSEDALAAHDRILARRCTDLTFGGSPIALLEDSFLQREVIAEQIARQLYPGFGKDAVWDKHTVFAHAPDRNLKLRWPEHPDGGWISATDALGMREDRPAASTPPDLRILVLGDSHTDGVCANDETFSNRLEEILRTARPERSVEVLNGGKGGWCAYNYLGAVEKWRDLEPDLVIVALYGGNDLVEAPLYRHYFERTERPAEQRAMAVRVVDVATRHPAACSQAVTQTAYLTWTGDVQPAVDTTGRVFEEVARTCETIGAELLVAYLPAPSQVELDRHRDLLDPALDALGLTLADLDVLDAARDTLLDRLASAGLRTVDLTSALSSAARDEPQYWRRDLHLGLSGHVTVAAALAEVLAAD
ncbi:MAG: SGNH/GDSL hydrolase family protein [Planctomycetota bacterium]|jgi:lysophospholipase L1-like esterase